MKPRIASRLAVAVAMVVVLVAPAASPTEIIQPAVLEYGAGFSGGGGGNLPPHALAITTGKPGSLVTWRLEEAPPAVFSYFLLGFNELALDLGSLGMPGADLLASYELLLLPMLTDGAGEAQLSLTIPNNPSLVGLKVFNQWIVADPNNTEMSSSTNGVRVTVLDA